MKIRISLILAAAIALLATAASAQMGITYFPGPGMVHSAGGGGGCTMNGSLDLSGTHTCNMVYYVTGVIK